MNPASLLLFALMALASPSAERPDDDAASLPTFAVPHGVEETALRLAPLSGFALRDALDDIAMDNATWYLLSPAMEVLASGRYADLSLHAMLRDPALHPSVPEGADPRLMQRTIGAFVGLAELVPAELPLAELLEGAPLDNFGDFFRSELDDRSTPVAIRRLHRKFVRGLVALLVLSTENARSAPPQYDELLRIAAEGAENLVLLAALNHDNAAHSDDVVRRLGLTPLDREQIQQRTYDLEQARIQLASTARDLDGEPLRLPPDPGLREDDT